ncbi:hypothetical protein [Aliikangiella coralliicola]|uniref:Uncharacterized protein n=1 Tax=Aliikangiella coralliicola TaxID=2592383 RepID=A0A545U097_9GAMM|nr:hypothetical protein [Aliikangiella coralliicola]TQV82853.1 hypothetical protein FLL46_24090 [Aliikangiella coralliicola]
MEQYIQFDATDLKRALQNAFAPVARNHHGRLDEKATFRNVEVLQGKGNKEGRLRIQFIAEGDFGIKFEVEVVELMKDYQKYIDGVMEDLANALLDAKQNRKKEKPIILLH